MDEFLATVGVQAMRYAIRSGIALTSSYALGQCSRLLKSVEDKNIHVKLKSLQRLLDSKIKIISPAIDLIEFKSGKGNVFLESAAPLARSLHQEIVSLGRRVELAAEYEQDVNSNSSKSKIPSSRHLELVAIIESIQSLLDRIDREIPLLQLAISASGESLSTSLPVGISPSRLLQASTFLIVGDTQFAQDPTRPVQIGPTFTLSLYMLFLGHAHHDDLQPGTPASHQRLDGGSPHGYQYGLGENDRKPLWQEVLHKARVRLCRARRDYRFDEIEGYRPERSGSVSFSEPPFPSDVEDAQGYAYHLEIIEDLDDGRLHAEDKKRGAYDGVAMAGIRESVPIHEISKIFYTDTGKILNIGNQEYGDNHPVLLLKRDINARPIRRAGDDIEEYLEYEPENENTPSEEEDNEQADIDQQLLQETKSGRLSIQGNELPNSRSEWRFPSHLDPEWIALEVYEEDEDGPDADEDGSLDDEQVQELEMGSPQSMQRSRPSLDSRVVDQIRKLSLRPSSAVSSSRPAGSQPLASKDEQDFVSRTPFGAITTSLSLMEMLIRLSGLQEVQQASHLSIPDHILTFFLEETSTTGLEGDVQWRARGEAKRRVGFDPYTDAPAE